LCEVLADRAQFPDYRETMVKVSQEFLHGAKSSAAYYGPGA
jgi:hypothetical protein